jgi:PAS domain S-box-containing protein
MMGFLTGTVSQEPRSLAERHVRAYLDAALDCVILADLDGRIVEFNAAAERVFGYGREDALGQSLAELIVPPSLRQRHLRAFTRFVETGETRLFGRRLELTGLRADGSEFPLELALSQVGGEPPLICGAIRDLSEIKRAEVDLRRLADQQAALRRVATLVAREAAPAEVFAAVAEECARVLNVALASVFSYDADGGATLVGVWGSENPFAVGDRYGPHPGVISEVRRTGRPALVNYAEMSGTISARLAEAGIRLGLGVPIAVGKKLWGVVVALSTDLSPLPDDIEVRLTQFTELVATAIANTQARDALRRLVDEQAALKRVATRVARQPLPAELFAAVAEEAANVLEVELVSIVRYEPDGTATVIAALDDHPFPVGSNWPLDGPSVMATVLETGRPARVDDYGELLGTIAGRVHAAGIHSTVGVPITVDRTTWGAMIAVAPGRKPLPDGTETRLADFTELVSTAISSTQARADLRGLVDEHAALRRVATLVARGTDAAAVFDAVCVETGRLMEATSVNLARFTPDGLNLTMAGWSAHDTHVPTGTQLPLSPDTINGVIQRTAAPTRFDSYESATSELGRVIQQRGIRSEVGAPISVEGRVWGALIAGTDSPQPLPAGAESRLARFAELVATAISNASARSELVASRARIVAAGDEARRRVERNLHDGAQQRLVTLGLELDVLRTSVPSEMEAIRAALGRLEDGIKAALEDVREVSRGLHPALLSQGGLGPSVRALARKCPLPVDVEIDLEQRPPESIEIAVYYVVSEALTNSAKHAHPSRCTVTVTGSRAVLRATIRDNGRGGAEASAGSGLIGLIDRVEALGGRFALDSPRGHGTTVAIELPFGGDQAKDSQPTQPADGDWRLRLQTRLADVADASTLLAAVANVADALYVVDAQGRIRFLNPAAVRILGYENEQQLLGRSSHETIHYMHPDGTAFPAAECPLLRPRVTGDIVQVDEDWFVRQDGTFVRVAYSSAAIPLPDGRGAVVSFRDLPPKDD